MVLSPFHQRIEQKLDSILMHIESSESSNSALSSFSTQAITKQHVTLPEDGRKVDQRTVHFNKETEVQLVEPIASEDFHHVYWSYKEQKQHLKEVHSNFKEAMTKHAKLIESIENIYESCDTRNCSSENQIFLKEWSHSDCRGLERQFFNKSTRDPGETVKNVVSYYKFLQSIESDKMDELLRIRSEHLTIKSRLYAEKQGQGDIIDMECKKKSFLRFTNAQKIFFR